MSKKILILCTGLLFTGCVERGYDLTVNNTTNTVTAIKSVDIRTKEKTNTKDDIAKMNASVALVQKKQKKIEKITIETDINAKKDLELEKKNETQQQLNKDKQLAAEKESALRISQEREALNKKQAQDKEEARIKIEKERAILAQKIATEKKDTAKRTQALKELNNQKEKEKLAKQLAKEKAAQAQKEKDEKAALERKIAKDKKIQAQKEKKEKEALERKIANDKNMQETAEKKRIVQEKAQYAEKIKKEKASQSDKRTEVKRVHSGTSQALIFKPSKQTYHKFGTSEIHGHVVYVDSRGKEIQLNNTKVYLVPKSTKTDHWYSNYYLKNKESSGLSNTIVNYMNATHLNLEKNFAFFGLAPGIYYVIIESSYPSHIHKNKKVYIAKKINVQKYKKIMTVFSKKL